MYTKQRFFKFRLKDLIQLNQLTVEEYVEEVMKDSDDITKLADAIIRDIQYPWYMGQPDDKHVYNAYHGAWCKTIELDYWDQGEEVIATRMGDCDGSSIAFVTCARQWGLTPYEVYELFGYVKDAKTNAILGGHAWALFKDKHGKWRLNETTLDIPPNTYPEVPEDKLFKPYQLGNIVYVPEIAYNDKQEILCKGAPRSLPPLITMRVKRDSEKKAKAISEAWQINTKDNLLYNKQGTRIIRFISSLLPHLSDILFGCGFVLVLWEIWEDCIKLGDNPISFQHGYYGLILLAISYTISHANRVTNWFSRLFRR